MPDPLSIIRLAALLIFIGLVALGLWLLDVAWWVVPPVMALALLIAWTIEWLAWRGSLVGVVRDTTVTGPAPAPAPPIEEEPMPPVETIAPVPSPAPVPAPTPPPVTEVQQPPPPPEQEPEPEPEPEPVPAPPAPEPPAREPPPPPPPPPPTPAEPPAPSEPVAEEPPPPAPEPEKRLRRPRRMRLRPLPAPPEPAPPPAQPEAPESPVVAFRPRTSAPRSWNLWDLERMAREGVRTEPERRDEWAYLFLHLREFAAADGSLPTEFDGLVRESFGGLLERSPGA